MTMIFFKPILYSGIFFLIIFALPDYSLANLVSNPGFEITDASGQPLNWSKGRYGINTANFIYPAAGFNSSKAAKISMGGYVSGDAKWYFPDVAVNPGEAYSFSDVFRSDAKTYVTLRFKRADGTFFYSDLAVLNPSSDWQSFQKAFSIPPGAVSLTIFHLIKSNGFLEVDNYNLIKLSSDPTRFDQGYVSLNFDDGYLSTYQNAIPILNSAGFKSDQFIVTGRMNPKFPGYVQPGQVLNMQARGHVIGAHSRTHSSLTALSSSELQNEISGSRSDLIGIGARPVNFFAYLFGDYNDTVKTAVKNSGFSGGRSSDGGYNLKTQDPYALRRQSVRVTTTFEEVKNYIDTALREKTWLILLFHQVDTSGNTYSVTPTFLQSIVNYLIQNNTTPITLDQGFILMQQ